MNDIGPKALQPVVVAASTLDAEGRATTCLADRIPRWVPGSVDSFPVPGDPCRSRGGDGPTTITIQPWRSRERGRDTMGEERRITVRVEGPAPIVDPLLAGIVPTDFLRLMTEPEA